MPKAESKQVTYQRAYDSVNFVRQKEKRRVAKQMTIFELKTPKTHTVQIYLYLSVNRVKNRSKRLR